jgi:hypothetical protein
MIAKAPERTLSIITEEFTKFSPKKFIIIGALVWFTIQNIIHAMKYRRNAFWFNISVYGRFLVFSNGLSTGLTRIKAKSPPSLQIVRITRFVSISVLLAIPSKNIPSPMAKKVAPPSRARFSGIVELAKYPIAAGIPNPNTAPKQNAMPRMFASTKVFNRIGMKDKTDPTPIQARRKGTRVLILLVIAAPTNAKMAVPMKLAIQIDEI